MFFSKGAFLLLRQAKKIGNENKESLQLWNIPINFI